MNNFNQTTIDYINAQMEVLNEDYDQIAETLLETTDIEEKKQQVHSLVGLAHNYEMLDKYRESYDCLEAAYVAQLDICKNLPKNSEVHMHLWVMALMNAHLCYKLNAIGTAIQYCTRFANVVKDIVENDKSNQNMLDIAHKAHLDLARLYHLKENKEKATEMLDLANGFSSNSDLYAETIDNLNSKYDEISFSGNLGDTYDRLIMEEMAADYIQNRYGVYQSISEAVPYDRDLQLAYLESTKRLAELCKDYGKMDDALQYGLACKDLALKLQTTDPEDKEIMEALYLVNDTLNLFYRLCEMDEEELATAIDMYHLMQLKQDEDKPMDEETINELSYDAYLLAQQSEKLGKIEQALKYYEQSLKWCEMLEGAEDSVERLKEEIEGVKGRYGVR